MTDTSPNFQAYEAQLAAVRALDAEIAPDNRAALFDALAAADIHTVVVAFDGYGDSGQIESVEAFGADNETLSLPAEPILFRQVAFHSATVEQQIQPVREVIESMAYDFLGQTHGGWEDNDGAYGEFTFSVAQRSIELDYNERYTASDYHHHEF